MNENENNTSAGQKAPILKKQIGAWKKVRTVLSDNLKESMRAVLPITLIVLILCFTITPIPTGDLLAFLIGATLLIVGMAFFTIGADMAMVPLGERVGSHMTKSRNLILIAVVSFLIGTIITISEPDLQVLANQVQGIPNLVLVGAVAIGVGIFLVIALLRIIFSIKLSNLLIFFYTLIFILAFFVPKNLLSIAFDSGGVTTGPMTVPFIMALGIGVSSIRKDKNTNRDSFGLVALSSIGPILAIFLLAFIYDLDSSAYTRVEVPRIDDSLELWSIFWNEFPKYIIEMAVSLAPIVIFFIIFQIIAMKLSRHQLLKMIFGIIYTYVGLVLFLTGVNVGFMPVGAQIGKILASLDYNWIIVPIAMIIGYFIIKAEPAVHVLNVQVERITAGAIPQKAMNLALSMGISVSLGLSMLRIILNIPIICILLPGYAISIILTFFVPKIFTSIAFDSGGVASGPMTATFLLSFSIGACEAVGGNIFADAFGIIAMVAMTPLITIQLLGVYYKIKISKNSELEETDVELDEGITELDTSINNINNNEKKINISETDTNNDDEIIEL